MLELIPVNTDRDVRHSLKIFVIEVRLFAWIFDFQH
jgi:hypothetical protein